jgi:23S rRNA (uridine2552-2'-O)-methyltransferase
VTDKGNRKGGSGNRSSSLSGGQRQMRTTVKTARKRSVSSARWLERQLNDPYVTASKREGLRSRAAFKLREIDARYHFLKSGQRIIDLGAAPGGWSQEAAERVKAAEGKGQVVAIDYLNFEPITGVDIIEMDFDGRRPSQIASAGRQGRCRSVGHGRADGRARQDRSHAHHGAR